MKVNLHSVYLQNLKCNGYTWKQVPTNVSFDCVLSLNLSIHNNKDISLQFQTILHIINKH